MKAKIIKFDGTVIELSGSVDEVNKALEGFKPQQPVQLIPYYPYIYQPIPATYTQPQIDLTPKIWCDNSNSCINETNGVLTNFGNYAVQKV